MLITFIFFLLPGLEPLTVGMGDSLDNQLGEGGVGRGYGTYGGAKDCPKKDGTRHYYFIDGQSMMMVRSYFFQPRTQRTSSQATESVSNGQRDWLIEDVSDDSDLSRICKWKSCILSGHSPSRPGS